MPALACVTKPSTSERFAFSIHSFNTLPCKGWLRTMATNLSGGGICIPSKTGTAPCIRVAVAAALATAAASNWEDKAAWISSHAGSRMLFTASSNSACQARPFLSYRLEPSASLNQLTKASFNGLSVLLKIPINSSDKPSAYRNR